MIKNIGINKPKFNKEQREIFKNWKDYSISCTDIKPIEQKDLNLILSDVFDYNNSNFYDSRSILSKSVFAFIDYLLNTLCDLFDLKRTKEIKKELLKQGGLI